MQGAPDDHVRRFAECVYCGIFNGKNTSNEIKLLLLNYYRNIILFQKILLLYFLYSTTFTINKLFQLKIKFTLYSIMIMCYNSIILEFFI